MKNGPKTARQFIVELAGAGGYHFTTKDVHHALDASFPSVRAALRRLKSKGEIATPYRGFHVIVPPEYRKLECLPAAQFVPQLMDYLGEEYYVGLLSAAQLYGAAHQQPQIFQVFVAKNRPQIKCGAVRVIFVAKQDVTYIPKNKTNTPRGYLLVSTIEATVFDLVGHMPYCGGINNVALLLSELVESIDHKLVKNVARFFPAAWGQRLGYLLELIDADKLCKVLESSIIKRLNVPVPLVPMLPIKGARKNKRWKVLVNTEVELDL